MLKSYFEYVQNVLGTKSIMLPLAAEPRVVATSYHFAVATLSEEARVILLNIAKALKAKKFDILELKLEKFKPPHENAEHDVFAKSEPGIFNKNILIIFGKECAQFLMPHTDLKIGQAILISGSQTLLTHSLEEMRERPELKREAWQHLKALINNDI